MGDEFFMGRAERPAQISRERLHGHKEASRHGKDLRDFLFEIIYILKDHRNASL